MINKLSAENGYRPELVVNLHPNKNRPTVKTHPPYIMGRSLASGTALFPFARNCCNQYLVLYMLPAAAIKLPSKRARKGR